MGTIREGIDFLYALFLLKREISLLLLVIALILLCVYVSAGALFSMAISDGTRSAKEEIRVLLTWPRVLRQMYQRRKNRTTTNR